MSFLSMLIVLISPFNTHTYTHEKTAHAQKLRNKMLLGCLQIDDFTTLFFSPKSNGSRRNVEIESNAVIT